MVEWDQTMTRSPLGALLTSAPPTLPEAEAAALAQAYFGVTGALTRLTSERDLNFRLTTPAGSFVLKLANPAEPAEVTGFQTAALLHLEGSGLPVPRVIRTRTGATEALTPHGTLRLLTYLEGMPLHAAPRSAAQRRAMGQMAARVSLGLQGFTHPAAHHVLQWDIRHASALRPLLPAIADDSLRMLATATLDRFDAELAPALPSLRWQVVHNDLNPHNVLVDPDNPDRISGILDFGDMVHTPLVCDTAVTAAYQIDPANPLESLLEFARGFHEVLPLTVPERALLPDLTAVRMLTTLAITSSRAARYPDNAPYILRNFASARDGLVALSSLDRARVAQALASELT